MSSELGLKNDLHGKKGTWMTSITRFGLPALHSWITWWANTWAWTRTEATACMTLCWPAADFMSGVLVPCRCRPSYVSVYMCIFLCTFNLLQILLRERVVINGLFLPWMHECVFIKRENVMDKLWKKKRLRSEGVSCNAVFAWRDFNHIHCFLLHWSTSPK